MGQRASQRRPRGEGGASPPPPRGREGVGTSRTGTMPSLCWLSHSTWLRACVCVSCYVPALPLSLSRCLTPMQAKSCHNQDLCTATGPAGFSCLHLDGTERFVGNAAGPAAAHDSRTLPPRDGSLLVVPWLPGRVCWFAAQAPFLCLQSSSTLSSSGFRLRRRHREGIIHSCAEP